jgi:RNA polymerase sigma-70 factor, ECF subfamily
MMGGPSASDYWVNVMVLNARNDHGDQPSGNGASQQNEEFVRLFAQFHDELFAYIFSLLPHWSDAEDVFQQTSLVLWRKYASFQPGSGFLSWACKVAFYEVQNFRRIASRDFLRFDDGLLDQLAEERVVSPQRSSSLGVFLRDCIAQLSDSQRDLLSRAYEGDATIKHLAEQVNRSPQTIYNRLNDIRRNLFECVQIALRQEQAKNQQ